MTDKQYRKKPVVIEAVQWFKMGDHDDVYKETDSKGSVSYRIDTLEGDRHLVSVGDWIITDVKGETCACKPDIFEMTHEPVNAVPTPPNTITIPVDEYEEIRTKLSIADGMAEEIIRLLKSKKLNQKILEELEGLVNAYKY